MTKQPFGERLCEACGIRGVGLASPFPGMCDECGRLAQQHRDPGDEDQDQTERLAARIEALLRWMERS